MNLNEIVNAWITSINPSEDEKKRSIERLEICEGCTFKKEILKNKKWSTICSSCGCVISKKIFSQEFNPCPLKKWEEVDKKYTTFYKTQKTIF